MNLRNLSDNDILSRIQSLTRRERETTLLILLHLAEIERRKLHFKLGYQSLFDYCTSGLGYSASAAGRRIQTARCVIRFPEVYGLLADGAVNLSTVSQVSRLLTADNKSDLLSRIRGKSQREVEGIVAEYRPQATPRDRVRAVVVRVPAVTAGDLLACDKNSTPTSEHSRYGSRCGDSARSSRIPPDCAPVVSEARPADSTKEPRTVAAHAATEKRILFQFSAHPAFARKLERVRSLLWHRLPANASLEQVFEFALDELIKREDPAARHRRREDRKGVASAPGREGAHIRDVRYNRNIPDARGTGSSRGATTTHSGVQRSKRTRHVPDAVRDHVFVRDRGRCTFVGSNGRRCGSTHALQLDHVTPFARGGTHVTENLRLLCANHNRLEAERLLGPHPRPIMQE